MSRFGKTRSSFDSEGTSLVASPSLSPSRSISGSHGHPHPLYYVQSPSRDSFTFNEGDTLSQSYARSTPSGSPLASPLHKSYGNKPHGDPTHFNVHTPANARPGSRRVLPQPHGAGVGSSGSHKKAGYQPWNASTIQEEEEQAAIGSAWKGISGWLIAVLAIFFSLVFILVVALTFWLVCRPHSPHLSVKAISFGSFELADGNDNTGVPTKVLSVNCTLILAFRNPSKYFGMHVSPVHAQLQYQQLVVATGNSAKFYQKKKSMSELTTNIVSLKGPVYGAGPSLAASLAAGQGVPLQLVASVQSRARVVWKIVKPKFSRQVTCSVMVDTSSTGNLKLLQKSCSSN